MGKSPLHARYSVEECIRLVLAPLELGQAVILPAPLAYASWAFMSDEASARMRAGISPHAEEWRSGPNVWLMDVIAPMGGGETVMADLQSIAKSLGVSCVNFNRRAKGRFGVTAHVA